MKLRTLTFSLVSLAALIFSASPARAQSFETNINVRQLVAQPSTTQAGGNPSVELLFRFCGPGVTITSVTGTGTGADPYLVTTAEPHGVIVIEGGNYMRIGGTGGTSGIPYIDGAWRASPIDADTFRLDT